MAIKKVKLPNNTVVDINDARIPGVDNAPTSGSSNLVSSGGVYSALSGKQATLVSGTNIKTVNNNSLLGSGNITIEAEDGVGFEDVSSQQDGTVVITLTNGDTVTIDLNHVHPQYPEYEHLEDESEMPATPDENTLYLIDGSGGGSSNIVHLDDESEMPVSPDPDTLYVIDETGGGSGYETTSNKVTSLSSSSTDTQYPSAKCVYDLLGDVETLINAL